MNFITVQYSIFLTFPSVLFHALVSYQTNILLASPWQSFVQNYTVTKINQPFGVQIMRGVGCNVLVCLAVWMATAAEDIVSKVFAIYFPIMLFVAIGFEHSVRRMKL
jgi:formate transporter